MGDFPSMKGREMLRLLMRPPLGYTIARCRGSHRRLTADGRPPLTLSYAESATIPPGVVRKILVRDVGLREDEALFLIRG